MSTQDRVGRLLRSGLPGAVDPAESAALAAALADVEAQVSAALCLYVQGDRAAVSELLGHPATLGAAVSALPLLAAFDAATEAITAAVGDDRARGYAALATLQERSAEYADAAAQLLARHAGPNPAN